MPNDELLTDDYVADLLAKDARDCSLKYSTMGMEAYTSSRKPPNLPKPNTRFLRNIIKDTNSHNAALLAREASESQARLERLERIEGRRHAKPEDIRKRQIGSINAILGNKPSRGTAGEASSSGRGSRRDARSDSRRRSRSPRGDRERERHRDRRDEERGKRRSEGHASHARKRQRHDESSEEDRHRSRRGLSHRRSRSPDRERRRRDRSTSRHRHSISNRDSDRRRDERKENPKPTNANDRDDSASDSDPLDDFIGPAPPPKSPVRMRGRGTISAFSGIDRRFAADYDPKLDVEVDAEADEWSDAVEAFRDRQKLRAAQEERMKAAGFSEEDLERWKDSGREKTEADVRWSKAGEKREWDIGKEVGPD
ncbi:hypothetical protein VUR80DRAFT_5377 [Thermomyces stellatus]